MAHSCDWSPSAVCVSTLLIFHGPNSLDHPYSKLRSLSTLVNSAVNHAVASTEIVARELPFWTGRKSSGSIFSRPDGIAGSCNNTIGTQSHGPSMCQPVVPLSQETGLIVVLSAHRVIAWDTIVTPISFPVLKFAVITASC